MLSTPPAFVLSQDQTLQLLSPDQSLGSHQKFQGLDFNLFRPHPFGMRRIRLGPPQCCSVFKDQFRLVLPPSRRFRRASTLPCFSTAVKNFFIFLSGRPPPHCPLTGSVFPIHLRGISGDGERIYRIPEPPSTAFFRECAFFLCGGFKLASPTFAGLSTMV